MTLSIDADAVARLLPVAGAVDVLAGVLAAGFDPSADPPRSSVPTSAGQLLLMPSEVGGLVGVKIASVAPDNPAHSLPRIQAVYVLMDAVTLTPLAVLDGAAITSLRTPALSALAVRHLATHDASRVVVFGTGPQAWGHVAAIRAVRPLSDVVVVGRHPGRTRAFVARVGATGLRAAAGEADAVSQADVVVCATTADAPLFAADAVPDGACVVAVGSHEPGRRELDAQLLGRATVVVEDRATALREAGDVVIAVAEGVLNPAHLLPLRDLVAPAGAVDFARPRVFKSVGMAWEDLAVAGEVYHRLQAQHGADQPAVGVLQLED